MQTSRARGPRAPRVLQLQHCTVDLDTRTVRDDRSEHGLSPIEARLLRYLVRHGERGVSRDELLREVWGYANGVRSDTVKTTVRRLRTKIEAHPTEPHHLVTDRGVYRLVLPPPDPGPAPAPPVLVAELDAWFGRTPDLDRLDRLFADARLVTLKGPGGMGKTRLSRAWRTQQDDASWFVELEAATSEADFLSRVAQALGLDLRGADAAAQLSRTLAEKGRSLLVLDNFEQLPADAARALVGWLKAAPALRILVTSRDRLHVRGEHVMELGPLDSDDARTLFVTRAKEGGAPWDPADESDAIDTILQRLAGLPLAIELAAARATRRSPTELAPQLDDALAVLRGRRRDVCDRHRTLRETIAWSWRLLEPWERSVLGQLSVFRGGFTRPQAEAVVAVPSDTPPVDEVLDDLMDRSLLQLRGGRLSALPSVTAFAEEAADPRERAAAADRHARVFAGLGALDHGDAIVGDDALERVDELAREQSNLRAAVATARANGDRRVLARCATALASLWLRRGPRIQGARFLKGLLTDHAFDDDDLIRLTVLQQDLAVQGGCPERKAEDLLPLVPKAESLGSPTLVALAWLSVGVAAMDGEDREGAAVSALERAGAAGAPPWLQARILRSLGGASWRRHYRYEDGAEHWRAAVKLSMELGDRRGEAIARLGLARAAEIGGQYAVAREALDGAERALEGLPLPVRRGEVEIARGHFLGGQGDLPGAVQAYRRALQLLQGTGSLRQQSNAAANLGEVLFQLGDPEAEAVLLHAIELSDPGRPATGGAARGFLAVLLARRGAADEARRTAERAMEILGGYQEEAFAIVLAQAGWVEALLGAQDAAAATLEKAEALLASLRGGKHRMVEPTVQQLRDAVRLAG